MIYIEQNKINTEDFVVLNENDIPVTGLEKTDFIFKLYNQIGTEVADVLIGITFAEIGNGLYRIAFTPDGLGNWTLFVYNSTYFPFGKGENYRCVENLGGIKPETEDMIKRILGLSQENYRIINPQYDTHHNLIGGIIKIYPTSADVETDTNSIANYQITAVYSQPHPNRMLSYKVKKL